MAHKLIIHSITNVRARVQCLLASKYIMEAFAAPRSRHKITGEWAHMGKKIIKWIIVVDNFSDYSTVEPRLSDVCGKRKRRHWLLDNEQGNLCSHQRRGNIHQQYFHAILPKYNFTSPIYSLSTWHSVVDCTQRSSWKINIVSIATIAIHWSPDVEHWVLRQSWTFLSAGLLDPTSASSRTWVSSIVWWDASMHRLSCHIIRHVHQRIYLGLEAHIVTVLDKNTGASRLRRSWHCRWRHQHWGQWVGARPWTSWCNVIPVSTLCYTLGSTKMIWAGVENLASDWKVAVLIGLVENTIIEPLQVIFDTSREGVSPLMYTVVGEVNFDTIQHRNIDLFLMRNFEALTQSDLFKKALTQRVAGGQFLNMPMTAHVMCHINKIDEDHHLGQRLHHSS